jgi:HSP90 family molecular chaperone
VAVAIALLIGMVQRTIRLRDFPAMLETSARVNGVILPIIAVAVLFSQALTVLGVPQALVSGMTSISDSPAVIIDADQMTASMRRIIRGMKKDSPLAPVKQNLEINPRHNIITRLEKIRGSDAPLAAKVAEQLLDNARVAAGLLEDPRTMLNRLNELLETVLTK